MKPLITIALSAAIILLLVNTRLGVDLIFGALGGSTDDLDVDPKNSPLILNRTLSSDTSYVLPPLLEQPSGMVFTEDFIYISTDYGELFRLDHQFTLNDEPTKLLSGILLFRQGALEAITIKDSQVLGIGELEAIGLWQKSSGGWMRDKDILLPAHLVKKEFTGICVNTNGIWATADDVTGLFNLESGSYQDVNFEPFTKPGADSSSLLISGIDCDEEYFYIITENYASIVILDKTFRINEVVGLDAVEASDIAIHNRYAYVTVDHNYFDPKPPVYRYNLRK